MLMLETLTQVLQKYGQFVRFVLAGAFAFTINLVALYFFTDIVGIYYLVSTVLAFLISFSVSFTLQKFWTFQDNSRDHLHIQLPLYLGMQLTNITLNAGLMFVFVEYMHVWYLYSQGVISLVLAAVIFFLNKKYIFKKREEASY